MILGVGVGEGVSRVGLSSQTQGGGLVEGKGGAGCGRVVSLGSLSHPGGINL